MSEQYITDDDAQQTQIFGFLRKLKRGEPLSQEATSTLLNRIYTILEGIAGEGCRVDKPLDANGLGWRVIIDGFNSDVEQGGRIPMPFELVYVDGTWRVWIKDAEVYLNNLPCTKHSSLDAEGAYTSTAFAPSQTVYLYITQQTNGSGEKHANNTYKWNLSTSVPTGALASVAIGKPTSLTTAIQYQRGNQILYTTADSEIIGLDSVNCVAHVKTASASGAITVDEHLAFVMRSGGVLVYYKAADLLKLAVKKMAELMNEEPDPELDPSEIVPIGDETFEEWEARMREAMMQCMVGMGWPWMPTLSQEALEEYPSASYFAGYGIPQTLMNPDGGTKWVGIENPGDFHLPPAEDLTEALTLLQEVKARLDYLQNDPDGEEGPSLSPIEELGLEAGLALGDLGICSSLLATLQAAESSTSAAFIQAQAEYESASSSLAAVQDEYSSLEAEVSILEGVN